MGAEAFGLSIFNCDWAIATLETLLNDANRELRERWRGAMREGDHRADALSAEGPDCSEPSSKHLHAVRSMRHIP